jgi:hypothetical protein
VPEYEIIYRPNSASARAGLETRVHAKIFRVEGRFLRFYADGGAKITVARLTYSK